MVPVLCELRQNKYLNNLIEQDHRFIIRLVKPGMGFFSFVCQAAAGYCVVSLRAPCCHVLETDMVTLSAELPWTVSQLE
ncbi:MAG TPA: hypothetical protein VF844_18435 [Ktedonobacteraceae bacterium]